MRLSCVAGKYLDKIDSIFDAEILKSSATYLIGNMKMILAVYLLLLAGVSTAKHIIF